MMRSRKRSCMVKKQRRSNDIDDKKDVINMLSLDALAKIFMFLPISERMAMEEVCFKWKEASELAWHDIKKYECGLSIRRAYDNRMLTQKDVKEILLRCGKYLNELILSKVCKPSFMPFVSNHCQNLTKLEFEFNHKFNNYNTNQFINAFTQLDKLVYIKIKMSISGFPNKTINSLSEEINEIHLFFDYYESKPLLFDLKKFKKLHSLTLNGCTLDNIIQDISEKITLVYLDLYNCSLEKGFWVFNQLENLEHLTISCEYHDTNGYERITSQVLSNILNTCKNLKHLKFTRLSRNREKLVFNSWVNLKNLEYLVAPWIITDESIVNIVKYCQNLKNLTLDLWEINISEFSIIKLTELKNLECLKLYHAQNVSSDKTITAIANNCKKLKRLEIPGFCKRADNNQLPFVSIFDELSKLQYLEYLDLASVYQLGDSSVIAIANECKNMKNLNIEYCQNITETGLMALTSLENLQILNVNYNFNITDNFISKLKRLKSFKCDGCKKITDVGVIQFIKNCPDLEHFSLGGNITVNTIIAADHATKNRINDIVLDLFITNYELSKSSKSLITSQWLTLR